VLLGDCVVGASLVWPRAGGPVIALDGAGEGDTGRDIHFPEDVVKVCLDRLLAEEQLGGDLGIRLAINDKARQLELAFS